MIGGAVTDVRGLKGSMCYKLSRAEEEQKKMDSCREICSPLLTENSYESYRQTVLFLFKLLHVEQISLSLPLFTLIFQMAEVCASMVSKN